MTKLVRELGPLAIAVAVFAAVIGVLLANGNNLGSWLLAAFLAGHGWVHITYLMPHPEPSTATTGGPAWPFDLDRSWLAADPRTVHAIGTLLVILTVAGYMLAALATVSLFVPGELWLPLVIGSTIASAALLGLFFSPMLLIGVAIDVLLIVAVVFSGWRPV